MRKTLLKTISLLPLLALPGSLAHADALGGNVAITVYLVYAEWGGGDIIFKYSPANAVPGCAGGWISPTQPNAASLFAAVVSAKNRAAGVTLYLETSQRWSASSDPYCKVYALGPWS